LVIVKIRGGTWLWHCNVRFVQAANPNARYALRRNGSVAKRKITTVRAAESQSPQTSNFALQIRSILRRFEVFGFY
jgi:hypothetical protein